MDSFAEKTHNLSGSDIPTIINRVKFMPLHLLYRSKKICISESGDHETSVSMFVDGDKRTSLLASFDEMVQKYVEDAILIPDVSGLFVFSEISLFTPTVSATSRQMYQDYIQKHK